MNHAISHSSSHTQALPFGKTFKLFLFFSIVGGALEWTASRLLNVLINANFSHQSAIMWNQASATLGNVAAVSILSALFLFTLTLLRSQTSTLRRSKKTVITLSTLSILPFMLIALLFPYEVMSSKLLFVGIAVTHILIIHYALIAYQTSSSKVQQLGFLVLALSSLITFISFAGYLIAFSSGHDRLAHTTLWFGNWGQITYFLGSFLIIGSLLRSAKQTKISVALGLLTFGAFLFLTKSIQEILGNDFQYWFYRNFHLDLLGHLSPWVYAIALGLLTACCVSILFCKTASCRWAGGALLLFLASGYAPTTPLQLLLLLGSGMGFVTYASETLANEPTTFIESNNLS